MDDGDEEEDFLSQPKDRNRNELQKVDMLISSLQSETWNPCSFINIIDFPLPVQRSVLLAGVNFDTMST
jgi:hypothetical protein